MGAPLQNANPGSNQTLRSYKVPVVNSIFQCIFSCCTRFLVLQNPDLRSDLHTATSFCFLFALSAKELEPRLTKFQNGVTHQLLAGLAVQKTNLTVLDLNTVQTCSDTVQVENN